MPANIKCDPFILKSVDQHFALFFSNVLMFDCSPVTDDYDNNNRNYDDECGDHDYMGNSR